MSLNLSEAATKLLSKLGSSDYVKIVRESGQVYDEIENTFTAGVDTEINCIGIVTKITDSLRNDTRIKTGDKMVLIDKAQTPVMTDRIKFDGNEYEIVLIDGYNHAGIQQFWKVVCRA